jgi:hypothetical protein
MGELSRESTPPVDRCPWCEDDGLDARGTYDGRVLRGGRGIYTCPNNPEHRWQNAAETPATCGVAHLKERR